MPGRTPESMAGQADFPRPLTASGLDALLAAEPAYRQQQVLRTFLDGSSFGWDRISTLPEKLRQRLKTELRESTLQKADLFYSNDRETVKALFTLHDGLRIESVLMKNARGARTVCLSSQAGCGMGCFFCATGRMGYLRNLDALEIVEQVAFWRRFLAERSGEVERISNVVYMGMGEPLMNYEAVRQSLQWILAFTDTGPNAITVSTIGVLPKMQALLGDKDWPPVKMAISLHAAENTLRKQIVPVHTGETLERLKAWCEEYTRTLGARTRPLTLEYVMLDGVNDGLEQARHLAQWLSGLKRVKVNLIPFNTVAGSGFQESAAARLEQFQKFLKKTGVTVTIRRTKGQDIQAACGQLAVETASR